MMGWTSRPITSGHYWVIRGEGQTRPPELCKYEAKSEYVSGDGWGSRLSGMPLSIFCGPIEAPPSPEPVGLPRKTNLEELEDLTRPHRQTLHTANHGVLVPVWALGALIAAARAGVLVGSAAKFFYREGDEAKIAWLMEREGE